MATVTVLVSATVTGISEANGLNDAGFVVGQEDTVFPFIWQPNQPNDPVGVSTQLPVLMPGGQATALAISNGGEVVGFSDALDAGGTQVTRAALWQGTAVFDLGTLMPDPANPGFFLGESRAADINASGTIVGRSDSSLGPVRAVIFDRTGGPAQDLGSLIPDGSSRATSINDPGDIVGVSDALDSAGEVVERAFLLPAGTSTMIDLGTLLPDPAASGQFLGSSGAFGINNNGVIIGTSDAGSGLTGAARFVNPPNPTAVLPVHSDGWDVGPAGHVVGSFDAGLSKGYIFHSSTGLVDLTASIAGATGAVPGMTIISATGVNQVGQITAVADIAGTSVAVLITP